MGKKGVILDNGRTAQSSMALYWKNNRDKSKHPKQKQPQQNEKQITDKSVMSNFQKWKMHKQKIISKAYTKPPKQNQKIQTQNKQKDDDYLIQQIMQSKKPKVTTIPGFKSKNDLANRLQIQKPKQANQQTNILKLPSHMGNLTQQQIVQMLRQRKSKQQMQKRIQNHRQTNNEQKIKQIQDMLLGDQYIDLNKKKKQENQEKQKQPVVQIQKQPEPSFFKSDILNKIQKQGISKVLTTNPIKQAQTMSKPQSSIVVEQNKQKIAQKNNEIIIEEQKPTINLHPKFIPRALKK